MNELFLELLRLSLGTQNTLSHTPSEAEWDALYNIAKAHSVEGICLWGLRKLCNTKEKYYGGMTKAQYGQWLGTAASLQTSNQTVTHQCVRLHEILQQKGFASIILKGQGVGKYYTAIDPELPTLRHSGDIDVWLWPINDDGSLKNIPLKERRRAIVDFVRSINPQAEVCYHHIDAPAFRGTEVEFHMIPSWFHSPIVNRRWVKWHETQFKPVSVDGLNVPTLEFNLVYILLHIYRHLFHEGIGMRQIVDYYFVLKAAADCNKVQTVKVLKALRLQQFAAGVMWIMHAALGLGEEYLLCEPDAREGEFLLSEILQSGNFGRADKRLEGHDMSRAWKRFFYRTARSVHFVTHYPSEVLWLPLWKLWHWMWRKTI